jgi:hypothetical protein
MAPIVPAAIAADIAGAIRSELPICSDPWRMLLASFGTCQASAINTMTLANNPKSD